MKAALIQMNVMHCQKEENLEQALEYITTIDADIIVLPEVFSTGFCYDRIAQLAESAPYPSIRTLSRVSKNSSTIIIGSIIASAAGGKFSNLGFVLDCGQLAGLYRKVHPFGAEKEYFVGGDNIAPIQTSMGLIGLMICYDIRFPEVARKLALEEADILVSVAQFPARRQDHWDTLIRARAIENQIPHLACNRVGTDPDNEFCGGSAVIDGWGNVLAHAGPTAGLITADIDPSQTRSVRESITCFPDRHEALY